MDRYYPVPTTHPSIPTATWTKVNAVAGSSRSLLRVRNEDPGTTYRLAIVPADVAADVPTLATDGDQLEPGDVFQESTNVSSSDVYAYQASGSTLTTLAVSEGQGA